MMRYAILYLLINGSNICFGQTEPRNLDIRLGKYTCRFNDELKPAADSAYELMSRVFSSREFLDSISSLKFPGNACNACGTDSLLTGEAILNILFARRVDTLGLIIKKSSGALGKTSPMASYTTAFYYNITGDMCNLPLSVGLAVNLCHEYMHHICFCHPRNPQDKIYRKPPNGNKCDDEIFDPVSYVNDIAYRIGWIAYDILLRWYREEKLESYP